MVLLMVCLFSRVSLLPRAAGLYMVGVEPRCLPDADAWYHESAIDPDCVYHRLPYGKLGLGLVLHSALVKVK